MSKITKQEMSEAKEYLRSLLKPGQKIYGEVVHVSSSGMFRVIRLKVVHEGEIIDISWNAAKLLEGWNENHRGCKASGCGMDMVFHHIYSLGRTLYPEGYQCVGDGCPCNDHSNFPYPKRDGTVFHNGDSGYCFRQA